MYRKWVREAVLHTEEDADAPEGPDADSIIVGFGRSLRFGNN